MSTEPSAGDDTAAVWTTASGAPERLVWVGQRFVVVSKPIPWVDRIAWWESSPRVPAGASDQLLEQIMWQVQIKALETGELLIVDLAVTDGRQWPISVISD